MEIKKMRLVLRLHPLEGIVLSTADPDNPGRTLFGKASARECILNDLVDLGLTSHAESLRRERSPAPGTTRDIAYDVTGTEELMKKLGFRETGANEGP